MAPANPVAIGGIGGSGTRVAATLLRSLGFYIGSDLNESLDNLWFTLLFKRRNILLETTERVSLLSDLFWYRMSGVQPLNAAGSIMDLAAHARVQHDRDWLQARLQSWLTEPFGFNRLWGWKEPNTHIIIDRLLELKRELRYVHILRNPLDMALSGNQNQLENWGPILLDRPVEIGPRDSLSYGCAVAKRIDQIAGANADRICIVNFDELCRDPAEVGRRIAAFVGVAIEESTIGWFAELVRHGAPLPGRHKLVELSAFNHEDLEHVRSMGYSIE